MSLRRRDKEGVSSGRALCHFCECDCSVPSGDISVAPLGANRTIFILGLSPPRDLKLDGGRQSAGAMSLKEIIGLEGVELGADGKVRLPGFQATSLFDRHHHKGQEAEAV